MEIYKAIEKGSNIVVVGDIIAPISIKKTAEIRKEMEEGKQFIIVCDNISDVPKQLRARSMVFGRKRE